MADGPPSFHGYGYDAWAGGPGSGFRSMHGGRTGEFLHGGSGSVGTYGATRLAGSVTGLGGSPHLATPQPGMGANLRPPGWSGGATPFSVVGAMAGAAAKPLGAAGQQMARSRVQSFSAAHSTPQAGDEGGPPAGFRSLSSAAPAADWPQPTAEAPQSRQAAFQGTSTFQQTPFDMSKFLAVRNA
jgi:hypothetical protein